MTEAGKTEFEEDPIAWMGDHSILSLRVRLPSKHINLPRSFDLCNLVAEFKDHHIKVDRVFIRMMQATTRRGQDKLATPCRQTTHITYHDGYNERLEALTLPTTWQQTTST